MARAADHDLVGKWYPAGHRPRRGGDAGRNLSGQPSPKSAPEVYGQLAGRIDGVLDGGTCAVGVESTILDLTATPYRILRQGGLSRADIEAALGQSVGG